MEKEELKEKIRVLNNTISELGKELSGYRDELALLCAEFAIGTRVEMYGKIYEIVSIRPGYSDNPKYSGSMIKKDGTLGVKNFELYGKITRLP